MLAPDTSNLLDWVGLYWNTYPEHQEVQWDAMQSMLNLRAGHLSREERVIMDELMRGVQAVPQDSVVGIVQTLNELAYSGEVAALTQRYQDGEEIDYLLEMKHPTA